MRTIFRFSTLLLLLLSACTFPRPGQPVQNPTQASSTTKVLETETHLPDDTNTECGYAWAREPLLDLSRDFEVALKEIQPQASGYAEAYGENCITNNGEAVRFLAMETDFYVTLKVQDLQNEHALGELIEQVMAVVSGYPPEDTPGPQPGNVGITFEAAGDELRLWFTQVEATLAIDNGLRGKELFKALQEK